MVVMIPIVIALGACGDDFEPDCLGNACEPTFEKNGKRCRTRPGAPYENGKMQCSMDEDGKEVCHCRRVE